MNHNIKKLPAQFNITTIKVSIFHCTNRIGDVVDNYGSRSAAVIHGSQAVVPLLPRRVPYLELHRLIVNRQSLREESCADG